MAATVGLDQGWAALARCDWQQARSVFESAERAGPSAETTYGLGQALYWLGDYERSLATLERAYALHERSGERRTAARIATQLALLYGLVHGSRTAVSGWTRHAERALTDDAGCAEAGWLALLRACFTADPAERARHAEEAIAIGRRFAEPGLEFDGLGYLGKAHVEQGRVDEGLALIDEAVAAVAGGLVQDPWATAEILCTLFHACELAADVRRAEEWLGLVDRHVERTGERPTYGICRMHYGGLLATAGRWKEAERELDAAIAVYDAGYRGSRAEPVLRLADLRVRQGRLGEAERLLAGCEGLPGSAPPSARLHLARGEPEVAAALLDRYLARRGRGATSAPALALLVEVELARGRVGRAERVARELEELGGTIRLGVIAGLAALSRARTVAARDPDRAIGRYEQALADLAEAPLPCELARARFELATLLAEGQPEVARAEARAALRAFQRIGAGADADAAAALLRRLGDRSRSWPRTGGELTRRESEVLALVAEGRSNADIAARLHISVRTAEHHVGGILAKLGVANRTEAAAHAVRHRVG